MTWLKNIELAPKLLAALAIMIAVAAALVVLAVNSLGTLAQSVEEIKRANDRLVNAGRATANLLAFVRNVESLPLELTPEQRSGFENGAADELRRLFVRLDNLTKIVISDEDKGSVQAMRDFLAKYDSAYRTVLDLVKKGDPANATKTAFANAGLIADVRRELRRIEERNDKAMDVAERHVEAVYAGSRTNLISIAAGGMLLGMVGALALVVFGVTRPLNEMTGAMLSVAGGNYDTAIPSLGQKDEIGQLAGALERFKEDGLAKLRLEAEQKEAEARAAAERKADMHKLADSFEAAVGGIVHAVSSTSTQLEAAASTLTHTADTTQQLSGAVAAASEEASANVQSVASATDEMAASVNEISRQVQESSRIAGEAVKQAEKTDARIGELSQAASRIGDVVKLITAIAEQTNLLALNATIEAARAGEAGRGFAVVASEVKALAAQTAKATDEIGTQIAGMQTATHDSVNAIKEISDTINRISEIASTIAAAVEEQGAATQEISRNVQQAAQGTTQVASNITDVNKGAAETGSASTQVLSSAQALSSEGGKLKQEVDRFLATVRAA